MSETVLIIEDDQDFAEGLKIDIEDAGLSASVVIESDFVSGLTKLTEVAPDVVVLDIFEGSVQDDRRGGLPIWEQIWNESFVPLVFASAGRVDEIIEYAEKHPLVEYVGKTESDAMGKIVDRVGQYLPFGKGIKELRATLCDDAQSSSQKALTETAQHTLKIGGDPGTELSVLKSSARRRAATMMRLKSEEERNRIFAWEQYLYPPPDVPYFLTGDIVASSAGDRNDPKTFRVVLTPSCDLAQKKVADVLVGRCVPLSEFHLKNSLSRKKKKVSDRLPPLLTQAQVDGYLVLPSYSTLIPPMAVSLRSLELLTIIDGIKAESGDGKQYERVASVDSPFREQLSWAYLQVAGRLGMPDRDMNSWVEEILGDLSESESIDD